MTDEEIEQADARQAKSAKERDDLLVQCQERFKRECYDAIKAPCRYIENLPIALNTPAEHGWKKAYDMLTGKLGTGMLAAFIGDVGPGKTQLAVALLRNAVDQACKSIAIEASKLAGYPGASQLFQDAARYPIALYAKASLIFHASTDVYRSKDGTITGLIAGYAKPRILVVDELTEHRSTEHSLGLLHDIVGERYDNRKDTIVISNDAKADLVGKVFGPRLADRARECGGILEFNWPSFRSPAAH